MTDQPLFGPDGALRSNRDAATQSLNTPTPDDNRRRTLALINRIAKDALAGAVPMRLAMQSIVDNSRA